MTAAIRVGIVGGAKTEKVSWVPTCRPQKELRLLTLFASALGALSSCTPNHLQYARDFAVLKKALATLPTFLSAIQDGPPLHCVFQRNQRGQVLCK